MFGLDPDRRGVNVLGSALVPGGCTNDDGPG